MTAAMLTPGTRVRHAYDGARGTVARFHPEVDMFMVSFVDGSEDMVMRGDVQPVGRPAKKRGRP